MLIVVGFALFPDSSGGSRNSSITVRARDDYLLAHLKLRQLKEKLMLKFRRLILKSKNGRDGGMEFNNCRKGKSVSCFDICKNVKPSVEQLPRHLRNYRISRFLYQGTNIF